jgi:crotonobetainyl-CoA:carnitine CoA-transferase CaiB-like acyl-CoA transferase
MTGKPAADAAADTAGAVQQGPLLGVRVIELGILLAGPFVGRILGDFGAEIIKVEAPDRGDTLRDWGSGHLEGRGLWWPVQSRNKKLVTLNLRVEEGQALLRRLVAESDVLVENFRPGTLERWNLSPEELWEINPGLVIARVSGYGQTGPYAKRAGFASAGEAMGGLRYINGFPGDAPPRLGISLGDSLAAMFAAQGVLMALYHRDAQGGKGQVIDASIMESCFSLLESMAPDYDRLGIVREPSGTRLDGIAPSNVYKSGDDKWVVIAANAENLWERLCKVMEREDLLTDPRFENHRARGVHQDELDAIVAEWAGQRTATEIDQVLNAAGVVCGPVYSIADIFEDPQYAAREALVTMNDPDLGPLRAPAVHPKLSGTPGAAVWTGPWPMGQHNDEIYGGLLGLSDDELARLREEGVV